LILDAWATIGTHARYMGATQCKIFDFIVGVLALSHPVQLELISILWPCRPGRFFPEFFFRKSAKCHSELDDKN
jgi:hypothetical protein